ncbi:MAG: heavy metal translocating P-type ATPase [Phycisphaerales bacterium]|nr:heavy metal translocating P-type ATPase [Phycisphaerales bacterium]
MPSVDERGSGDEPMSGIPQDNSECLCDHCGLVVPMGLFESGEERQFCCNGCKTVYRVLRSAGLEGFYSVRDAVDPSPMRAASTGGAYEELDDPAFQKSLVRALPGGEVEVELLLEGMHCAACVWLIERLPRVAEGVVESRANIRRRTVCVRYRPDKIQLSKVAQKLDRLGYAVHPARGGEAREIRLREDRRFLVRVAVAGALAGNVMLLAIALYEGEHSGMSPFWQTTLRWYSMVLGILVLLGPGRLFYRGAIASLRTRTAHLDLPIALALTAGGVWGAMNTVRGTGEIYFDSLAVLVFLLLVGRWVQHRQQRSASDSVELMLTLTPTSATVIDDQGQSRRVPIESVEVGMIVAVGAGESVPADGEVSEGETELDVSLLTGESRPIVVGAGDRVTAGATNLRSPIRVCVQAVGESTRVGKLMELIAQASAQRTEIVRFADRVAGRFVIVVVVLAMGTFVYWNIAEGIGIGIEHATALLIVTCPCALGLATPMAMSVAMGRAASAGMLVKSAAAIEVLAKPGTMILDKTGTITEGRARVAVVLGDTRIHEMAAAIEKHCTHPIAHALVDSCDTDLVASQINQTIGQGVQGVVDGVFVKIGSPEFVLKDTESNDAERWVDEVIALGHTPVVASAQGIGVCVFGIGDQIREGVVESIKELIAGGWDVRICSGDHPEIVRRIGNAVGVEIAEGGVSPEGKAALVARLKSDEYARTVAMVGDGVNDAAALAAADVGIAVHGGAEASLEAADVYLADMGVFPLVRLVKLSSKTMRTIRLAFVISLSYNTIAAVLAMTGVVNALMAAVLMPISSLSVVALCVRSWREDV